jgi:hypothetical protein
MISLPRLRFDVLRKRAVILTAEALLVFHWRAASVTESFIFEADDSGLANFDRYLRESPALTTYMLVDLVDEEYRQEAIPHVYGADRQALIARKQAWLFRGTPYCHVLPQGREQGGRRDDRVLFSAILNPEIVAVWVRLFTKNKVPLAGIYSLPLLSGILLAELGVKTSNTLLVTMQSCSGLRQTYFHNGAIKLSRLAKMPRLGSVPYAPYVLSELEKFQRYLGSLRLAVTQPLDVLILTHGDLLEDLAVECPESDTMHFLLADVSDAAQRLEVQGVLTTPFSDYLFAHLLLRGAPKNHYATRAERSYASLHSARRALWGASLAMVFGSSLFGGWNLLRGMSLQQGAEDNLNKALFYENRYEEAKRGLPPTVVEPADIKAAVGTVATLRQHRVDPMSLLITTSQALQDYPAIRIEAIDWSAGAIETAGPGATPGFQVPTVSGFELAVIKGRIEGFDGDFRHAIATVNGFAEALRRLHDVREVTVLTLPLDVSSKSNLQGGSGAESRAGNADFVVRIVLESRHEVG